MNLPEEYLKRMQKLLGEEYKDYLDCFEEPSYTALRVNTLKVTPEEFEEVSPFLLDPVSWTSKGYYYNRQEMPSKHPLYFAGLFYIQEPSAMIPATLLPVEPGERVLDLCAAPGGKATELAAKLQGRGVLVANDISVSRAMALAKNLQMAGVVNSVVTGETPERLAQVFPGYFDKILVDAPCSGEGMFRREPGMVKEWMEHGPQWYAPIQREILEQAYCMLRPGGMLLYSTCTFSPEEDEGIVQWLLNQHPDMNIHPIDRYPGFGAGRPDLIQDGSAQLQNCVRVFPHRVRGEGHFAALLQKLQTSETDVKQRRKRSSICSASDSSEIIWKQEPFSEIHSDYFGWEQGLLQEHKGKYSWLPPGMEIPKGLRIIANGLLLGEQKKQRFEPSVQLALALQKDAYSACIDLSLESGQAVRYLKGETLFSQGNQKGYLLVCVNGYPLGWVKGNGQGMLKNKYYAGWRMT